MAGLLDLVVRVAADLQRGHRPALVDLQHKVIHQTQQVMEMLAVMVQLHIIVIGTMMVVEGAAELHRRV